MHYVYIVICRDQTLYTGYTTDLIRRIYEHNTSKKGAKYTRNRRPVKIAYAKAFVNKQQACRYEYEIKQKTRKQKEALISGFLAL